MSDSNKNTEYNDELKRQNQQQEEQSEGGTPSTGIPPMLQNSSR